LTFGAPHDLAIRDRVETIALDVLESAMPHADRRGDQICHVVRVYNLGGFKDWAESGGVVVKV
jgi:hypothetical protein